MCFCKKFGLLGLAMGCRSLGLTQDRSVTNGHTSTLKIVTRIRKICKARGESSRPMMSCYEYLSPVNLNLLSESESDRLGTNNSESVSNLTTLSTKLISISKRWLVQTTQRQSKLLCRNQREDVLPVGGRSTNCRQLRQEFLQKSLLKSFGQSVNLAARLGNQ